MTDDQLLRYSRHILLDEIGIEGQTRLLASHALILGAGGLGSPVALYLASAGIGTLTLVDDDTVDLTNLQRQIAHRQDRLGLPKVDSAAAAMQALNSEVVVRPLRRRVDAADLEAMLQASDASPRVDVVIDCSDNFATRQAANAACVRQGVPLVSGAAIRFDGQVSVFDARPDAQGASTDLPCYACLFPPGAAFEEVACATMGVFAPLVGIIGSVQAAEALKLLAGIGTTLAGRLSMLDARTMAWTTIGARRDPECPVCSAHRTVGGPK